MLKLQNSKAFTLIELLIVVVIIGILAGIVLAVLQPATQQRRARQAVFQSHVSKACTGLMACAATTTTAANCGSFDLLGVANNLNGNPVAAAGAEVGSTYSITTAGSTVTINADYATDATGGNCAGTCSYNFATAVAGPVTYSNCIVGN